MYVILNLQLYSKAFTIDWSVHLKCMNLLSFSQRERRWEEKRGKKRDREEKKKKKKIRRRKKMMSGKKRK